MSANLDKFQILTLAFGAAIVASVVIDYNNSTADMGDSTSTAYEILQGGFPFLLAAYALIVSGAPNGDARMYKNFIIAIIAVSWFFVIKDKAGVTDPVSTAGWNKVLQETGYQLAVGGFFALPIVLCGFRV